MNDITLRNQEYHQDAPPEYASITGIPMWNLNTVRPSESPLDDYTQPPAYDTLPDLPIWTVPLSDTNRSFSAQQWNMDSQIPPYNVTSPPEYRRSNTVLSQTLYRYRIWKSPPAILGVLLLLAAFAYVGAGTVLGSSPFADISSSLKYGIPFRAPVCYVITGCLLLTAHVKPFICQVRSALSFSIITAILSCVALIFNVSDQDTLNKTSQSQYPDSLIKIREFKLYYILMGTSVALLCLSVSAVIFGSGVLCRSSRKDPQETVIENDFISPRPPSDLPETPLPPAPPYTPHGVYIGRTTQ